MLPVQAPDATISARDLFLQAAAAGRCASRTHRAGTAALILAALTVLALFADGAVAAEPLPQTQRFQFELWAQNHCPEDIVVWVNARSQIYNSSEERWYGRTTDGAFACKLDAEKAGYRAKSQL
jgi:hypothetical protein